MFKDMLKELRLKKGLSQEELGRLVGLQKAAINKYETGVVINPKPALVEALAKALDTTAARLMGWDPDVQHIPIYAGISSGKPFFEEAFLVSYDPATADAAFALRVKDDSMTNARICLGDTVYVSESRKVKNNDITVVLVKGDSDVKIRRFSRYADKIILKPENSRLKEQEYSADDIQLLGKVTCANIEIY